MKNTNLLKQYYAAMKILEKVGDEETRQAVEPLLHLLIQNDSKLKRVQGQLRDLMAAAGMFEHEGMKCDLMVRGWEKKDN
tara:strand:+ start:7784 stop:8023 length:240 start_codon:yes stop_codon:yes gene_type:complete